MYFTLIVDLMLSYFPNLWAEILQDSCGGGLKLLLCPNYMVIPATSSQAIVLFDKISSVK